MNAPHDSPSPRAAGSGVEMFINNRQILSLLLKNGFKNAFLRTNMDEQANKQEASAEPAPAEPQEQIQAEYITPQQKEQSKWTKKVSEWWLQLKKFSKECRRVLKVTQKPNKEEFLTIAKVSALGMTIIGLIGFVLSMAQQLILYRL